MAGLSADKYKYKSAKAVSAVFFHERSLNFNENLVHSYNLGGILDLTAASGTLAFACLTHSPPLPYIGITLCDHHSQELTDRLESLVFQAMQDPKCKSLYDPMLAQHIIAMSQGVQGMPQVQGQTKEKKVDTKGCKKQAAKADQQDLIEKLKQLQAKSDGKKPQAPVETADEEEYDEDIDEDEEDEGH